MTTGQPAPVTRVGDVYHIDGSAYWVCGDSELPGQETGQWLTAAYPGRLRLVGRVVTEPERCAAAARCAAERIRSDYEGAPSFAAGGYARGEYDALMELADILDPQP